MIDGDSEPVAWPLLLMQLDDAREHLDALIRQMSANGSIDEIEYGLQLGHIYAHLNRAWAWRSDARQVIDGTSEQWEAASRFPTDLEPNG